MVLRFVFRIKCKVFTFISLLGPQRVNQCATMVPVCETLWENIVQPDRPQVAIWRMHIACWMPKAIHTQVKVKVKR